MAAAVKAVKAGQIDFRVDKAGIIHTSIGKSSFTTEQINDNALAFIKEIVRLRPAAAKGAYVKSVTLSTTMGPAIPVDRSIAASVAR